MRAFFHNSTTYPVWIRTEDQGLVSCRLDSVSEYAGRLEFDEPCALPERFDLLFSTTAQSWRECSVVWRSPGRNAIGIKFLARHMTLGATWKAPKSVLSQAF